MLLDISSTGIVAFTLQFLQAENQKQITCHSWCIYVKIFGIKKAKTTKNILDKKALIAGTLVASTVAPALSFLILEKQK